MKKLWRRVSPLLLVGLFLGACGTKDPTALSDQQLEAMADNALNDYNKGLNAEYEPTQKEEILAKKFFYDESRKKYYIELKKERVEILMKQVKEGDTSHFERVYDDTEIYNVYKNLTPFRVLE